MTVRISSIVLSAIFAVLALVLYLLRDTLVAAHLNGLIDLVSSDGGNYYQLYQTLFADLTLAEAPALLLVGWPIILMKLSGGTLWLIQALQLLLMLCTLRAGAGVFATLRGRLAFIAGTLVFPYFLFGFASLNKEVYAMCSAIFFACYMVKGVRRHLAAALILALCARYYMLVALLALLVLFPRERPPRYRLIVLLLLATSLAAPFVKLLVPGYSSDNLIEVPTLSSELFSRAIDGGAYALVYPLKYLVLIPTRAYSFLIDPTRLANGMEAVVSLLSMVALLLAAAIVLLRRPSTPLVRRLILMALVAPIPIMWTEIMHWRYYSFVYFFLLYALVLHGVDQPRAQRLAARNAGQGAAHA